MYYQMFGAVIKFCMVTMYFIQWDGMHFGLPAENYAIQKKVHPATATAENVANFKRQLQEIIELYMTGIKKLIQQILTTINGHNGSSLKCLKMA